MINIAEVLPSMIQGFQGLTMISDGADMAVAGANYQAASFRTAGKLAQEGAHYQAETLRRAGDIAIQGAGYQKNVLEQSKTIAQEGGQYTAEVYSNAGSAAIAVANYNRALQEVDTNQALDAMGRQIKNLFSSNQASMGTSGISLGSKSYLAVTSDAMATYERSLVQIRNGALRRQQGIMYEGNLTATEYMNNANAAKYSANIATYNYDNQIASADYQARIAQYSYNNNAIAAEYAGAVEAYNYEAQARQAEYQGEIAEYNAGMQSAQAIGGMVGKGIGAMVSLF